MSSGSGSGSGSVQTTLAPRGTIVVGDHHACAVQATGKVMCWGAKGRLGVADKKDHAWPVEVAGVTDAVGLDANRDTTCAWTSHGEVWCWGGYDDGYGDPRDHSPRVVPHLADATQVVVGSDGACALRANGNITCFPRDAWSDALWPRVTDMPGFANAVEIAGDTQHLCARRADHSVVCTVIPDDQHYRLRDQVVTEMKELAGATSLAGHDDWFAALLPNHRLVAFDIATIEHRQTPAPDHDFYSVATDGERIYAGRTGVGAEGFCVVGGSHPACWGIRGITSEDPAGMAADEHPLDRAVRDVAYGEEVSCQRVGDRAQCWGLIGRLGDGGDELPSSPVAVKSLNDAVQLEGVMDRMCVAKKSGKVACWGQRAAWSTASQGKPVIDYEPADLPGVTDAVEIAMTYEDVCARRRSGTVTCWQADTQTGELHATDIVELANSKRLFSGLEVCGVDDKNQVACTNLEVPAMHPEHGAAELTDALANGKPLCVTSGPGHDYSCVHGAGPITQEHTQNYDVWCEVVTHKIQCHYGSDPARIFEEIPGLTNVVQYDGQYALLSDGTVTSKARQTNYHYENEPPLAGFREIVELRGNLRALCGRHADGTVACWGPRDYLGSGQQGAPGTPVEVANVTMGAPLAYAPLAVAADRVATPSAVVTDLAGAAMMGPFADVAAACKAIPCPTGEHMDCRAEAIPGALMPAPPAPFSSLQFLSMDCRDPAYRRDDHQSYRLLAGFGNQVWMSAAALFEAGGNEHYCGATIQIDWQTRDVIAGGSPELVATVLSGTSCMGANGGGSDEKRVVIVAGAGKRPYAFAPIVTGELHSNACRPQQESWDSCVPSEKVDDHAATWQADGTLAVDGVATYRFRTP